MTDTLTLAFFSPGPMEMLIIGVIAVLLFGNRLPSVMRSLGRGFVEFKRGLSGIEEEIDQAVHNAPSSPASSSYTVADEPSQEAAAPRFEPPPEEKSEKAEA